jgi:hypothetical protein
MAKALTKSEMEAEYAQLSEYVFAGSVSTILREGCALLHIPLSQSLIKEWGSNRQHLGEYFNQYYSYFLGEGRANHAHDLTNERESVDVISLRYALSLKKAHLAHALGVLVMNSKEEDELEVTAPRSNNISSSAMQAWEAISIKQTQVNEALIAQIQSLSQEFAELSASVNAIRDQATQKDWEMTSLRSQIDRVETEMKHWRERSDTVLQAVKMQTEEHGRMLQALQTQSTNPNQ